MSLESYLERVDHGENLTVTDMYREGAEEEIVDLLEYGRLNGSKLEVPRSSANKIMYDNDLEDTVDTASDLIAEAFSALPRLESIYDQGVEKADRKMEELNNKYSGPGLRNRVEKKADRKDTKLKAAQGVFAASIPGFVIGNQTGSHLLMAGSAAAGGASAYKIPELKGMKDREVEEAAKGLEAAYGGYKVELN